MKRLEELQAEKAKQADDDIRVLVSTRSGRRLLWRLLQRSGLDRPSFADSDRLTAFNEGMRAFGLQLGAEVQRVSPDGYAAAFREALDDGIADKLELERAAAAEEGAE